MGLKSKIAMGMASIAIGATAVIGGTFAYFSDQTTSTNQFTNGKLVMRPGSNYIEQFDIKYFKPGDKLVATTANQEPAMTLNNQGNLPFDVYMKVGSSALDKNGQSASDMDKWVKINSMSFGTMDILAHLSDGNGNGWVDLEDLEAWAQGDAVVNGNTISGVGQKIGTLINPTSPGVYTPGAIKSLKYELEFVDNGQDQNFLQEDVTNLIVEFNALQQDGTTYDKTNLDNYVPNSNPTNPTNGGGGTWTN